MYVSLVVVHPQREEITKAYPTQKLGPNSVGDCVDYITAILSRVDVHGESSFAKWHVDILDYGVNDGSYICCVRGLKVFCYTK
jgi:hypothetical protein